MRRTAAAARAGLAEHVGLPETIAFALPLLDFPEGPHRRRQQGNHHGQKQPCQIRSGETSQHHLNNAIAVPERDANRSRPRHHAEAGTVI
jgi:hypothetical protein